MRLADFIDANMTKILAEWDLFASSLLPAADSMSAAELRNHAAQMLEVIAKDLRTPQTPAEQLAKSIGQAPVFPGSPKTAAQTHALSRATCGFNIRQLVAEYRALRASVLRLWAEAIEDIGRFNEAVDQAIAESVDFFSAEVDRWRNLLLGTLGHELRGPLNAISMTAQLINEMSAGRSVCQHTAKLIRGGERMTQLLDDLLDYNRISLDIGIRLNPARVDLAAVSREEIELLRTALPASTIELDAEGPLLGNWDASRVRQAISNLVTNAAKYGDSDGTIRVQVHGSGAQAHLSVENSGPNISKEVMNSLFEPLRRYASADSRGACTSLGLGLFVVRQVAHAHGGEVFVESANGKTCFTMILPLIYSPGSSPDVKTNFDCSSGDAHPE